LAVTKCGLKDTWLARFSPFAAAFALVSACGGKAQQEAPSAPEEPTDIGGDGGETVEPSTGGRASGGSGGVSSSGGTVAAGGAVAGGTAAGTTSTGGKPVLGEPVYFKRGSARLSPGLFGRTLERLFDIELDSPLERDALAFAPGIDPKLGASSDAALVALARSVLDALSADQLTSAVGCDDTGSECRGRFIDEFAGRAWRRPLDDTEIAALEASFDRPEPDGELATLRRVTFEVISSPNAYWLRQMGSSTDGVHFALDSHELASLISYGVAGEPPDVELRELADDDALGGAEQRVAQVERLLAAGVERPTPLEAMIRDWLWIRDADDLPSSATDPDLAQAMLEETGLLISELLSSNAPIARLLDADFSFVNEPLAELYGLDLDNANGGFARVELGATPRRGILHHASFLTSSAWGDIPDYAGRGGAVAGALCVEIPRKPPNVTTPPPPPPQNSLMTGRQRYAAAVSESVCAGCHSLVDPIGYAFDHFDSAGAHRETDAGAPIETASDVPYLQLSLKFESSTDLVEKLATDPRYTSCFLQRSAESWIGTYGDPAAIDYASREMERGASTRIVDVLDAWVSSAHFEIRVK
jgi:hypothetical protein